VTTQTERRIFSLAEARELLPTVQQITADAVREAERLAECLQGLGEEHPEQGPLSDELNTLVTDWARSLHDLGVEVKGLWLADFDNGQGYYCWAYPEPSLSHYHGYEDGFAGRMTIQ
jgi:hypothetical protein